MNEQIGLTLKEQGLDQVEAHNERWVDRMREWARAVCITQGRVAVDDLRRQAAERGLEPEHQNAWGAVFRGPEWVCIGRKKSTWPSNHAREVRVWQWVPEQQRKAA